MLSYFKWLLLIISIYVQAYYSVKFIQNDPFLVISLIILVLITIFMFLALLLIKEEKYNIKNSTAIKEEFISNIKKEFLYSNNIPIYNIKFDYEPKNIEAIKFIIGSFFIAGLLGSFFGIGETLGDSISSLSSMKNIDIVKLISPLGNLKTVIGVSISGLLTALTIETFLQDLYFDISKLEESISREAKNEALLNFNIVRKEETNKFDSLLEIISNIGFNITNLSEELPNSLQNLNTNIKNIENITNNFRAYGSHLINNLKKTSDLTLNDLSEKTNSIYDNIKNNNDLILDEIKNNNKSNLDISKKIFNSYTNQLSKNNDFINNILEKISEAEIKNFTQLENISKNSKELFSETKNDFIEMFNFMDTIQRKQYDNIDDLHDKQLSKINELYDKQLSKNELSFNSIIKNLEEVSSEIIKTKEALASNKNISKDINKFVLSSKELIENFKGNIESYKSNLENVTKNINKSVGNTEETLKTIKAIASVSSDNLKEFQKLENSYKNMFNGNDNELN